jgi:hypothetical protein
MGEQHLLPLDFGGARIKKGIKVQSNLNPLNPHPGASKNHWGATYRFWIGYFFPFFYLHAITPSPGFLIK